MINKLMFNNLITKNKANIQKARAQTIQKLVRKLRKVREQGEENSSKSQTKQRRITVCMDHVKKLKPLDIVQNVLLFEKNPAAVLSNEHTLPEESATAMLAMNTIMKKLMECFKRELNLKNGSSAKWKDEILAKSRRREKISRTEEKRQKRKELKEQKAVARKRLEWVQENVTTETKAADTSDTNPSVWNVEELPVAALNSSKMEPKLKKSKVEKAKTKKVKINIDNTVHVEKKKKTCENAPTNEEISEHKEKPSQEVTHEIDSFFFTDSGENYLSSAVNQNNKNDEDADNSTEEKINRKAINMKTIEPNNQHRTKRSQNRIDASIDTNYKSQLKSVEDLKDLHPSWAAKQKMRPVITAFQGKKITFDVDDA